MHGSAPVASSDCERTDGPYSYTDVVPLPVVTAADVVHAGRAVRIRLGETVDLDWSTPVGSRGWDVRRTVVHMVVTVAEHTLYAGGRSPHLIALTYEPRADATSAELLDSLDPLTTAFAHTARYLPPRAYANHPDGSATITAMVARVSIDLLVHAGDVMAAFGLRFDPPLQLVHRLVEQCHPELMDLHPMERWPALLVARGRPPRPHSPTAAG